MRNYRIVSLLRQGVFCCVILIVAAGCGGTYQSALLYYDVPRPDGGVDQVRVYIQEELRVEPVVSVTNRSVTSQAELDRILALIYIPPLLLTEDRDGDTRTSPAFGDPALGIRPKS